MAKKELKYPWEDEKRTEAIILKVEPSLKQAVLERAGEAKMRGVSQYLRELIIQDILNRYLG